MGKIFCFDLSKIITWWQFNIEEDQKVKKEIDEIYSKIHSYQRELRFVQQKYDNASNLDK